jgi:ABC-2 type transport system ATP-binding protein
MRQKIVISAALLHDPDVVIFDEPETGLDVTTTMMLRHLVRTLASRGKAIMYSSHILEVVEKVCDRIIVLHKGKVVAVDTPDNLTSRLRGSETMYVQLDPMGADAASVLAAIDGVTRVSASSEPRGSALGLEIESDAGRDIRRELAAAIVNRGWGLLELRPMRLSLEDVFLKLTMQESDQPAEGIEPPAEPPATAEPASDVEVARE